MELTTKKNQLSLSKQMFLALKQAENCDKIIKSSNRGKLCGIPIAVKDIFCTKSQKTQAAWVACASCCFRTFPITLFDYQKTFKK